MVLNEAPREATVRVDIGELALDGFGRGVDAERVTAAFRAELTRLVRERGCRSRRTAAVRWTGSRGCRRCPRPLPRAAWARSWRARCTPACRAVAR